jgi:protein SCO1/2
MIARPRSIALLLVCPVWLVATFACRKPPVPASQRYPVKGKVVEVALPEKQLILEHEDIPGYMPAMTMPFPVRDSRLLKDRAPGDLVIGTLVVAETSAWLEALEATGSRPLPPDEPMPAAGGLAPGSLVPEASFVDQKGQPVRLSHWRGHPLAVTFVFTRCPFPDFCPALDRSFARLGALIASDPGLRSTARLLTVSFDPEHDTPAVLAKHAAALRADPAVWTFVTGRVEEVDAFGRHFGLSVTREGGVSGLTHNLRTAVLDPAGRVVEVWTGSDWEPEQVASALRRAAAPAARDER